MNVEPESDLTWVDAVNGTTVEEMAVAVAGGDVMFTTPGGLGSEVAVYIRRTGR